MKMSRLRLCLFALALLVVAPWFTRQLSPSAEPALPGTSVATDIPATKSAPRAASRPVTASNLPPDPALAARQRADALTVTTEFTAWLTAWRRADSAAQPALIAAGRDLALARRAALKHLIQTDPRLALEQAVPDGLRRELPAEVEAQLERRIDARGDFEVTIACLGLVTRIDRAAIVAGQRYEAFTFGRRAEQPTKFGLPLHGIAIDDVSALSDLPYRTLDEGEKLALGLAPEIMAALVGHDFLTFENPAELELFAARLIDAESKIGPYVLSQLGSGPETTAITPPRAANTPWILGNKRVLWVQVDFADDPGGVATPAEIEVTNAQVSEFYAANSQGKTTMSFTVLPVVLRMVRDKSVYNASSSTVSQLQTDAAVLAKAYDAANGNAGTYDPDRYDRWIVLFKRMPAYTFGGQAQITGPQVRLNGGISPGTTYHELGHTQGLFHSHYWLPSGATGVGAGTHVEYGDVFDAMGSSGSSLNNHFNAAQKAKLGYLEPAAITTVTQAGTYRLSRHDHKDAAGIRGLKITPEGLGYEYWVDHRRFGPTYFSTAQMDRLNNGMHLHWGQGKAPKYTSGPGTYLIDATAGSAGGANDAPYRIGETFIDPDAGVIVKPLAVGGATPNEYIDVQVSFGAVDGNRNPILQAELPPGTLAVRTNLIFRASATDPDGDPVYYRWDFGDGLVNPNFDNLTRRFAKGGTYSLRVSAHDGKGGVAAKTLEFTIADPLVSWTRRTSGTTVALTDVIHAAGRFVACGSGMVVTSSDGANWTPTTTGLGGYFWQGLAHSGTRFLVVGYRTTGTDVGGAAYSDDGATWTTVTIPSRTSQMTDVAFGAGRFVVVGDGGQIFHSTDGATWTRADSPVTNFLRAIRFADGLFVATGDSGRILTSLDGITWSNRSVATANSLGSVARYQGAWQCLSATLEAFTSVDGATWTRVATAGRTSSTFRLVAAGGVMFATTANGSIAFAEDPRQWTTHQIDSTANISMLSAVEAGGQIVVVGSNGLIYTATAPTVSTTSPLIAAPSLRNEADSLKVDVGRRNVLAAGGVGFTKLELYANGVKVSELNGTAGALTWKPTVIGTYSLVVRGVNAAGESVVSSAVPAVAGLPNWNWRNPSPVGNDLRGAVRVGKKWWIVGGSGSLLTLDANGTLTPLDFPTTQNLTAIAYGNGRFVASGPYYDAGAREEIGSLWTSTDGYAWTPLLTTVFDNFNLNFVSFSGDQWLAGSTGGLLLTSTDGINWSRQISGLTTSIRSAAFGNGTWVAVGVGGRAVTSRDGVTWTSRGTGVTTDLNSIAFREGMFVAVGANGVILVTGDGVGWARQNSTLTSALNAVGYVKGTWVVAGDAGVTRTSLDLTNWTAATMEDKFSNSLFVGGSGDEGLILGRAGEIFTTVDPAAWNRLTQGAGESRLGVIYAGGRFVAVGSNTDAITRTPVVPVQYSADGVTWTRAAANPAFGSFNGVAYGQGRYVAVGPNSSVFTSTDAATWNQSTFNTAGSTLTAVAAGPSAFVAVSSGQAIYSSVNGTTWSQRAAGLGVALRAAAYGNGRFVVVGDGGFVRQSTDGSTWTAVASGVTANLLTIGWWEEHGFIAAGANGTMIGSSDGITWQGIETGVADTIYAISKTPIGLVAVAGSSGALLVSLDGASWSTATLPADRIIRGLAASPNALVAVGDNGATLTFELTDTTPAPAIIGQPISQTAGAGNAVTLTVDARNASTAVFQWAKDGVPLVGANSPTYVISALNESRAGRYTVTITTATGSVTSNAAVVALGVFADPGRLINLSILTSLSGATDSFTFGVVVGGPGTSGTKPLLVRAVGPSLVPLGVTGVLQDPKLEFFTGSAKVGENDNWGGSASLAASMAQVGAFPYSGPASRDAAIAIPDLSSGANSARISGSGAGTVIAELYDATPQGGFTLTTPRLVNVSVLKDIGTGLTAGFVVGGSSARTVLVRAIGPTLGEAPFNVPNVVADPQLALFAGQSQLSANDNWGGTAALRSAFTQVGAFSLPANSRDAALVATLQPGNYTVQVSGVGGTTGTALVEVYEVP